MSEKTDAKALRAPDAFQRAGGEVRDWMIGHASTTVWVVGGVAVVALIALLFGYFQRRGEERAEKELGKALRTVQRPVGGESVPGETPPFATQQAKDEEVVKVLSAFRAQSPGTHAARVAALPLGQAQLRLGKPDEALPLLAEFSKHATAEEPMRALAAESEGYAHESRGDLVQARAAFERMSAEAKTDFLNGMGLYHRARILALEGKKQEAAAAFTEVGILAPATAAARLAQERTAELARQGIVAPTPVMPGVAADAGKTP